MITHRRYINNPENMFSGDYLLVQDFLLKLDNPAYSFGWWDHQCTRSSFMPEYFDRFGLWFEEDNLVAIACTEQNLGIGIVCTYSDKKHLYDEMIEYAKVNFHDNGSLILLVPDLDKKYQEVASKAGFYPTQERETESLCAFESMDLDYKLPDGFVITDMTECYNPVMYERIMRRGFSNDMVDKELTPDDIMSIDRQFKRPFVNLDLHVIALAPDKSWAAFCGIYQTNESKSVFIEPVVTDPDFQKMGLAKAAVYEALSRCKKSGSTTAVVYSSQQFYFNIGFRPNSTSTWWELK